MKRVLVSVGVFAAIAAAAVGTATAEAPQQANVRPVADASSGSSDLFGKLLLALASGSAAECDGVMLDVCTPIPA
ncbi:hypothetical protein [Nocardia sp. NPDC058633]|uniref:hypothetical protein n=1 Tax=Nocardia sp. NPDC058633 TaxID=3346568 RepID=UPI003668FFF7